MIKEILDLSRWAPSADNSQPWRFELIDDTQARIHGLIDQTRIYDYYGSVSQFSIGCLLETIRIAATSHRYPVTIRKSADSTPRHLIYDVILEVSKTIEKDPLADQIIKRVTNRFPLSRQLLSTEEKKMLENSIPSEWKIAWFESFSEKKQIAQQMYAFDLMATPATSGIIEWNVNHSKSRLPDESLGLDPLNLAMARWIFKSPVRTKWFMDYLGGKYLSAFLGFFLPAMLCSGHFTLISPHPLISEDDYVEAGKIFQRLWLTAANQNLYLQLESGPIIFSRYVRDNTPFTENQKLRQKAGKLAKRFEAFFTKDIASRVLMLVRYGRGSPPHSRAIRLSLDELLYCKEDFK